ncbi:MAG: hypothetical protein CGU28_03295 [Candidatus Dactylopiibacterium carminicum]|nr:MAG: hypothetical protein CGU28_03295 [Candidatus Dactylopiibacterium carminicum]
MRQVEESLAKSIAAYEPLVSDATDRANYDKMKSAAAIYVQMLPKVLELARTENSPAAADLLRTEITPAGNAAFEALKIVTDYNRQLGQSMQSTSAETARHSYWLVLTVIVVAVLVVVGTGWLLIRSIGLAVQGMQDTVKRIETTPDFTLRAPVRHHDEIGETAIALNSLIVRMQENLKEIAGDAQQLANASERLSNTSNEVAEAANQQSSAAASMAATMEEMTVSINHVGDRATEANMLSVESGRLAEDGSEVIGQTVTDINEIAHVVEDAAGQIRALENHSQNISRVIAVIRDVADQTNLLALNAAIEAARAGEQGRGFAVVADEVRKLAERTSSSTQEITSMIDAVRNGAQQAVTGMAHAVERVSARVDRARNASLAIQQISTGSHSAVEMVGEITSAIREQSAASTSIAQQVEHIATMAEQSSAAAHGSAEAARQLDQLAERMQRIVAGYRL